MAKLEVKNAVNSFIKEYKEARKKLITTLEEYGLKTNEDTFNTFDNVPAEKKDSLWTRVHFNFIMDDKNKELLEVAEKTEKRMKRNLEIGDKGTKKKSKYPEPIL